MKPPKNIRHCLQASTKSWKTSFFMASHKPRHYLKFTADPECCLHSKLFFSDITIQLQDKRKPNYYKNIMPNFTTSDYTHEEDHKPIISSITKTCDKLRHCLQDNHQKESDSEGASVHQHNNQHENSHQLCRSKN